MFLIKTEHISERVIKVCFSFTNMRTEQDKVIYNTLYLIILEISCQNGDQRKYNCEKYWKTFKHFLTFKLYSIFQKLLVYGFISRFSMIDENITKLLHVLSVLFCEGKLTPTQRATCPGHGARTTSLAVTSASGATRIMKRGPPKTEP